MTRLTRSLLAAATTFAFSATALAADDTIRIGFYCPLTGGSADMGVSARNGIRLAFEEINGMAGGVNGRKLELVERDDLANPEHAKKVVEELIQKEKVVATMGVCNTGVGLATIDAFQTAKVPLIVPVSTGTPLTKKFAGAPENWIFRVSPRDEVQAPFIVADALKRGFRKIALFADTSGYGEAGKNDVEKALAEAGLKPVSVQRFAVGVKDLAEQVKEAKAAGADVVISYTVGPEAAVLAKAIQAQKWNVQLMGSWPLSWRNFIDGAGSAGEGTLVAVSFLQQAGFQRRNAFITAYQQKYNTPVIPSPMAAAQGYDAALLLFYALHQAQSTEPAKIKLALENLGRQVAGVITTYDRPFSKSDHDALTGNMLVMGVVRKGAVDYAYKEDAQRGFIVQRKAQ
ncbi:MAG TPA: ABC transporter substrate-binding protein [Azospira sp.]|nr:ABC transporter substrate-binding protein [Azospira sp.]HNN08326.1 ABC transporter substrate-binding protein [Azospira sp.]HNN44876.1 ABC transporter substrate-binding protein [Azospira sp.]